MLKGVTNPYPEAAMFPAGEYPKFNTSQLFYVWSWNYDLSNNTLIWRH